MSGQWQADGTFKHDIPNARTYYQANLHSDGEKWLLLENKAGWGKFYDSVEDILSLLREVKKQHEPCYWSHGYRAWTYPGNHLFEQVEKGEGDWVKVEYLVFLNGEKV